LIELHEFGKVEFGLLNQFDLLNEYILKGEDLSALLLNSLSNRLLNELASQLLQSGLLSFADHNLHHLLADGFLL